MDNNRLIVLDFPIQQTKEIADCFVSSESRNNFLGEIEDYIERNIKDEVSTNTIKVRHASWYESRQYIISISLDYSGTKENLVEELKKFADNTKEATNNILKKSCFKFPNDYILYYQGEFYAKVTSTGTDWEWITLSVECQDDLDEMLQDEVDFGE